MQTSKFLDMVLGVDLHFELVPVPPLPAPVLPVPFPAPFMAIIFDPMALAAVYAADVPVLGTLVTVVGFALDPIGSLVNMAADHLEGLNTNPVLVNGVPATNTMSAVATTYGPPHIVIPPGLLFEGSGLPTMSGDGKFQLGSSSVWFNGRRAVRTVLDLVSTCFEPVRFPHSLTLSTPMGMPVDVGGFPTPDLQAMLSQAAREAATHAIKEVVGPAIQRGLARVLPPGRIRQALSTLACFWTGHPVDVATGRMFTTITDWELPGAIPLVFQREYASVVSDRDGALGFGWNHPLDQSVWVERGRVVYRGPDGREIQFDTVDLPGHVMRVGDALFDPINRLTLRRLAAGWEVETIDGLVHSFGVIPGDARQGLWRLQRMRSRDGHEVALEYDARGLLEWVRDSEGRLVRFEHDARGHLVAVSLPHPTERGWLVHTRYEYSREGNLVAVTDPLGNVTRYEYAGHLMVRETDRTGLSFYFGYDGTDSSAWCMRTWGDGGIFDHEITYDKAGRKTYVENSLGHTTVYVMDEALAVIEVRDPHGAATKYAYNDALQKVKETRPDGSETVWEYDARGNCTRVAPNDGPEQRMAYDPRDLCVHRLDGTGAEWQWTYDSEGRVVTERAPDGTVVTVRYEAGRVASIERPGGRTSQFAYDPTNRIDWIRHPNGGVTQRTLDALGRVTEITSPVGGVTRARYNALGDPVSVLSPTGVTAEYAYDPERNLVESRDATRHVKLTYGGFHKVIAREEAGARLGFEYNTEDQLKAVVNEKGERYTFTFDATGRVRREEGFDGAARTYLRDKAGRVTETTLPSGRRTEVVYTPTGQLAEVKHDDGTFAKFAYDAWGRLAGTENESAKVEFARDPMGRITGEQVNGREVHSRYGDDGLRAEMSTSVGARAVVVRDALGLPGELHFGDAERFGRGADVRFARDLLGAERQRHFANGIDVEWGRDLAGRPTDRRTYRGPGGRFVAGAPTRDEIGAQTYQWRGEDQIAAIVDGVLGPRWFDHDARGRLVRERRPDRTIDRAMDAVGNVYRTWDGSDRRYGAGGVLKVADGVRYEHDEDGNQIAKIEPDGKRWGYAWNGAGMLREVHRPDGVRVQFEYDAFARRTAKRVLAADGALQRETSFVWDGHVVVHEIDSEDGLTTWHWEPGTFTPVAKERAGRRWVIASDHLGTPTEMYDEAGRVAWEMQLDVWGVARESGEAGEGACPWRWPGQYEDRDVGGLYYNNARWYDPARGEYVSSDPIGLEGGARLHGYVEDPGGWIDPWGLAGCKKYEVGTFEDLQARSATGDGLDLHHVGQAHALEQVLPGYARETGIAIALPTQEHRSIPNLRGPVSLSPRDVLARDIRNLRRHTNTPNSSLLALIALNRQHYPQVF